MKRWTPIFAALAAFCAAGLAAGGCFRNVESTVELRVPEMRTETDARRVGRALRALDRSESSNVRAVEPDLAAGVVRVRYNNVELGLKNLQMAVVHAGYAVDELPADESARAGWAKGD